MDISKCLCHHHGESVSKEVEASAVTIRNEDAGNKNNPEQINDSKQDSDRDGCVMLAEEKIRETRSDQEGQLTELSPGTEPGHLENTTESDNQPVNSSIEDLRFSDSVDVTPELDKQQLTRPMENLSLQPQVNEEGVNTSESGKLTAAGSMENLKLQCSDNENNTDTPNKTKQSSAGCTDDLDSQSLGSESDTKPSQSHKKSSSNSRKKSSEGYEVENGWVILSECRDSSNKSGFTKGTVRVVRGEIPLYTTTMISRKNSQTDGIPTEQLLKREPTTDAISSCPRGDNTVAQGLDESHSAEEIPQDDSSVLPSLKTQEQADINMSNKNNSSSGESHFAQPEQPESSQGINQNTDEVEKIIEDAGMEKSRQRNVGEAENDTLESSPEIYQTRDEDDRRGREAEHTEVETSSGMDQNTDESKRHIAEVEKAALESSSGMDKNTDGVQGNVGEAEKDTLESSPGWGQNRDKFQSAITEEEKQLIMNVSNKKRKLVDCGHSNSSQEQATPKVMRRADSNSSSKEPAEFAEIDCSANNTVTDSNSESFAAHSQEDSGNINIPIKISNNEMHGPKSNSVTQAEQEEEKMEVDVELKDGEDVDALTRYLDGFQLSTTPSSVEEFSNNKGNNTEHSDLGNANFSVNGNSYTENLNLRNKEWSPFNENKSTDVFKNEVPSEQLNLSFEAASMKKPAEFAGQKLLAGNTENSSDFSEPTDPGKSAIPVQPCDSPAEHVGSSFSEQTQNTNSNQLENRKAEDLTGKGKTEKDISLESVSSENEDIQTTEENRLPVPQTNLATPAPSDHSPGGAMEKSAEYPEQRKLVDSTKHFNEFGEETDQGDSISSSLYYTAPATHDGSTTLSQESQNVNSNQLLNSGDQNVTEKDKNEEEEPLLRAPKDEEDMSKITPRDVKSEDQSSQKLESISEANIKSPVSQGHLSKPPFQDELPKEWSAQQEAVTLGPAVIERRGCETVTFQSSPGPGLGSKISGIYGGAIKSQENGSVSSNVQDENNVLYLNDIQFRLQEYYLREYARYDEDSTSYSSHLLDIRTLKERKVYQEMGHLQDLMRNINEKNSKVIIYGLPRYGKTSLCKAIAKQWAMFVNTDGKSGPKSNGQYHGSRKNQNTKNTISRQIQDYKIVILHQVKDIVTNLATLEEDVFKTIQSAVCPGKNVKTTFIKNILSKCMKEVLLILDDYQNLEKINVCNYLEGGVFKFATLIVASDPFLTEAACKGFNIHCDIYGLLSEIDNINITLAGDSNICSKMVSLSGFPTLYIVHILQVIQSKEFPSLYDLLKAVLLSIFNKSGKLMPGLNDMFNQLGRLCLLMLRKRTIKIKSHFFDESLKELVKVLGVFHVVSLHTLEVSHGVFLSFFAVFHLRQEWSKLKNDEERLVFMQRSIGYDNCSEEYIIDAKFPTKMYWVGMLPDVVLEQKLGYGLEYSIFMMRQDVGYEIVASAFTASSLLYRVDEKRLACFGIKSLSPPWKKSYTELYNTVFDRFIKTKERETAHEFYEKSVNDHKIVLLKFIRREGNPPKPVLFGTIGYTWLKHTQVQTEYRMDIKCSAFKETYDVLKKFMGNRSEKSVPSRYSTETCAELIYDIILAASEFGSDKYTRVSVAKSSLSSPNLLTWEVVSRGNENAVISYLHTDLQSQNETQVQSGFTTDRIVREKNKIIKLILSVLYDTDHTNEERLLSLYAKYVF